ncbi:hypothetical protein B0H16DRAFT_1764161 [Mycena metata]|uniref:Uncharacterized protein n=1 Tax=Mycena metata TaxID=1033252 RepID=A0AAD7MX56_9AGAR|nr:hypothetical protein B0H16DRAFT_1764161 [Mycena metata]
MAGITQNGAGTSPYCAGTLLFHPGSLFDAGTQLAPHFQRGRSRQSHAVRPARHHHVAAFFHTTTTDDDDLNPDVSQPTSPPPAAARPSRTPPSGADVKTPSTRTILPKGCLSRPARSRVSPVPAGANALHHVPPTSRRAEGQSLPLRVAAAFGLQRPLPLHGSHPLPSLRLGLTSTRRLFARPAAPDPRATRRHSRATPHRRPLPTSAPASAAPPAVSSRASPSRPNPRRSQGDAER